MNIDLEALSSIPKLMNLVLELKNTIESGTVDKKWLSTKELTDYIPYKIDAIRKKVKEKEFIEGVHYYKSGKILCFSKSEIDNWVMGIAPTNSNSNNYNSINTIVDDILSEIAA